MEQIDNHTPPHSAARGRRPCSAFPWPAARKCLAACVQPSAELQKRDSDQDIKPKTSGTCSAPASHQSRPRLTSPPASVDSGQRGGSVVVLNFRVSNERKLQRSLASPPPRLGQLGKSTNCGVGSGNGGDGARRGAGHAAANGSRCEPARATWCYHGGEPEFWGAGHGARRRHARGVSLRRTWPASLAPSVAVACMPALTDNWCVRRIVAHAQLVQTGQ